MSHAHRQRVTIIAAIDFTRASADVARLAAGLARRFGDKLLLVHAVEPTVATYEGALPVPYPVATAVDVSPIVEGSEESLRRLQTMLASEGLEIETRVLLGPPDGVLEGLATELEARLLVVGTHGRGPVGRLLIGSVAQRLLLHAPCAVLVVREGGGHPLEPWLSAERPLRVVVGVDRKGRATDAALDWVRKLCAIAPCEVTMVHEYWPPAEYERLGMRGPRSLFETDPEVAVVLQRELEAKVGTLAWAPNARLLARAAWGSIGEALARAAADGDADLVVVGSEQPHGWQRVKRGSAALSALHAVAVPLLCVPVRVHPDEAAEQLAKGASIAPALRSVLVATDLSQDGNAAVAHAYSLLRAEGGVVQLATVDEGPLPSPAYAYAAEADPSSPARRSVLEALLYALIPAEAKELDIETRLVVIEGGEPSHEIVAAALRLDVDAIVVASHGRSGVKRAVLGSVAEAVLRKAEIPVYVVRRGPDGGGP